MMANRLFLALITLTCVIAATPIKNEPPGFEHLFNINMMEVPTDTVAFSSDDVNHTLMRIVYKNFMGRECVFDASDVTINENMVKCTFQHDEIAIDRRKISHMYIIEID